VSALYRLTVVDQVDARLSGRIACSYTSPPQPLDDLRVLAAALLNGARAPAVGIAVSRAIAGGRRTVHITPPTPANGNTEAGGRRGC